MFQFAVKALHDRPSCEHRGRFHGVSLVLAVIFVSPLFFGCAERPALGPSKPGVKTFAWEAPIPVGSETNPVALNVAFHGEAFPNRDLIEELKDRYEIAPHSFPELKPKAKNDGIFEVSGPKWPPDMAGIGPFYLVKADSVYYALTPRNFALLFSPIENKEEVLAYLTVYESLFGNRFAEVVTEGFGRDRKDLMWARPKPPRLTEVTKTKDGFRVNLITYTVVHINAFFEETLLVRRDGSVKQLEEERILQKFGEGIVF